MHVAESLSLTACSQGILGRISRAQWLVLPIVLAALFGEPSAEADERSAPHRPEPARLRPLPKTAKLLFTSNQDAGTHRWEVYAMDARGRHVTRITRTDENHFLVGIDRSRRFIAATRGTEKRKRVWLLDLKTGTETPLTDPKNHAEGRSFSPDGKWIVFWMVKAGDQFSDIYKIRRDGTGLTNLTRTPRAHEFDPAWSNSGHAIAYSFNNGRPHRFVLRTMARTAAASGRSTPRTNPLQPPSSRQASTILAGARTTSGSSSRSPCASPGEARTALPAFGGFSRSAQMVVTWWI